MRRRFRGLSLRDGPDNSYDGVVIGAGIGGLICANLLARNGLRVLLVEQHYMVGGYCSTFRRKGFTFDAATHFYPLLGNPATITGKLLSELGITASWIKMDPVDHFHFPDGSSFSVPADFGCYIGKLKAEFPEEAHALDDFFALVREAYLLGLLEYFRGRHTDRLNQYQDLTLRQVLDRYFENQKLKLLLAADCPHWGSSPCRTSFVFDSMLRLSYFLGNYYPVGGSQAFADELAERFEQRDGHILLNSLVTRISIRNGGACGVEVETGPVRARWMREVRAEVVISNADLLLTVERMIDCRYLGPGYLESIRKLRPTYPCFLTHIGLKNMPTEILRKAQGYYWDSWDPDQVGRDALKFKIFVPTLLEPNIAPPGSHIVIIQKVLDMDYQGVNDWSSHKASVEQFILANLEQLMPGFSEKIVTKLSATALTSHRYTRNHQGAMLGWEMSADQLGDRRPSFIGPVKNLYFVGHWVQPGGGITPVIVSAMRAAKAILESEGFVFRPNRRNAPSDVVSEPAPALAAVCAELNP
jgi:phytoene dehydrogenase-like protein